MAWPASAPVPDGKGHLYRTDAGHLFAINRFDGQILWQYDIPGDPGHPIPGGLPVLSPNGSICFARRSFYCIDADGKKTWRFDPDRSTEQFIAPPIFDERGTAYLFCREEHGSIYAVAADGRKKWSQDVVNTNFQYEPMKFGPDGWLWYSNFTQFVAFDVRAPRGSHE